MVQQRQDILRHLPSSRTLVMGILNLTPDSFSDGGQYNQPELALEHALQMVADGADLIDIGGESTRPGARRVDPLLEQQRILPVIEELAAHGLVMSVDTLNPQTASLAVAAGAHIVNDVSGMSLSDDMIKTVAELGVPYILTHARGNSQTMDQQAGYANDPVDEVVQELGGLRDRLLAGGVDPQQLIVDPGLGFAKVGDQDWQLLAGLDGLKQLGHPVLVAGSRKRFIGSLLAEQKEARGQGAAHSAGEFQERDYVTAAISTYAALQGAWAVRVHCVRPSADAVAAVAKIKEFSA